MNVFTLTNCVVSKGYENNPAIRYNSSENGESAFFRVGEKVYDKRARTTIGGTTGAARSSVSILWIVCRG